MSSRSRNRRCNRGTRMPPHWVLALTLSLTLTSSLTTLGDGAGSDTSTNNRRRSRVINSRLKVGRTDDVMDSLTRLESTRERPG